MGIVVSGQNLSLDKNITSKHTHTHTLTSAFVIPDFDDVKTNGIRAVLVPWEGICLCSWVCPVPSAQ